MIDTLILFQLIHDLLKVNSLDYQEKHLIFF